MNVGGERLDRVVSAVLRSGVLLAAALVLTGGIAFLVSHRQDIPDCRKFHAEPTPLSSIHGVVQGAIASDPLYLIQLGLLILIATPVVRACAAGFAFERDWTYATVSLIVLALLIAGVGFGL